MRTWRCTWQAAPTSWIRAVSAWRVPPATSCRTTTSSAPTWAARSSEGAADMGAKYFGASVRRREDPRYLRGEGRFVDDIKLPGMLHVAFVRSPYAHARITAIRTEAAKRLPGVAHVFTFADLDRWMKPLPLFGAIPPGLSARVAVTMKQVGQ